jgi:hypothetical protein
MMADLLKRSNNTRKVNARRKLEERGFRLKTVQLLSDSVTKFLLEPLEFQGGGEKVC